MGIGQEIYNKEEIKMLTKVFDLIKMLFYRDRLNYNPFIICVVVYIITYLCDDYFFLNDWDTGKDIKMVISSVFYYSEVLVGIFCFIQMMVMSIRTALCSKLTIERKIINIVLMLAAYFIILIRVVPWISDLIYFEY